jgi:hypothetical protein
MFNVKLTLVKTSDRPDRQKFFTGQYLAIYKFISSAFSTHTTGKYIQSVTNSKGIQ